MVMQRAEELAKEIRQSAQYLEFIQAEQAIQDADTAKALIKEYKRLQIVLQMSAVSGGSVSSDDMQRFSQISSLLYAGTDTSRYLLAEMQLQRMMADVFKLLTDAAGLQFDLPSA